MIVEASDLIVFIESIKLKKIELTTTLLAIDMNNPHTTFNMVKQVIDFYTTNLNSGQKGTIINCLIMIESGVVNTLLIFIDQYYKYGGSLNTNRRIRISMVS